MLPCRFWPGAGLPSSGGSALAFFEVDAGALGDAAAVILVAVPEVPDHAQRDVLGALLHVGDEVGDQVVALPVLEGAVALAGLLVVVRRAGGLVAAEMALDPLVVVLLAACGASCRPPIDARLVVDVLVLIGARSTMIGHLAVALVGLGARLPPAAR